jgi:WD40 repeat protein
MITNSSRVYLLTGGSDGKVTVRNLYSLDIICTLCVPTIIRSLALGFDDNYLFVGLENGTSFIFPFPALPSSSYTLPSS